MNSYGSLRQTLENCSLFISKTLSYYFTFYSVLISHPFLHFSPHLHSNMELGCLLGGARSFIDGSVHIHRHGEHRSVDWPRLGQQAILQSWSDLVQAHQGVHWLVGVYGFTVEDCDNSRRKIFTLKCRFNRASLSDSN